MALRMIVQEGDSVLNKVCRPVTAFDERLWQLIDDMRETLNDAQGYGLAAPQVGILRRVFISVDERNMDEDEEMPEDYELSFLEFINPEIISSEGEVVAYEGCLSFPGHNGEIVRPKKVTVRAFDRFGKPFTLEAEDMLARCICHETNHLDGITIMQLADHFLEDEDDYEGDE
ncbi:MAG: peptide deformylase [Oscillospiraceae bacterium]